MKKIFLFSLCLVALASCKKTFDFEYTVEEAKMHDITTSVTATGTIEPVTSVEVGTQVSGIVSKLYVDYNSVVKAGQVIAELDKTNLMSELSSTQANLKSAECDYEYQKKNYERMKVLYEKGLISTDDYDKAHLSFTKSQLTVNQLKESVKKAQTNLGYATITSPIDGIVLSKEVEEGQTVASSFNTPTLFKIAQDLTQMRVVADVDEADIGEITIGHRVSFTVDAYPNDTFEGVVTQVRQEATTTSNVVTYEVVITAPNDDLKLKPGLTASINIYTLELKNVLTVPNKALHFTPNQEMMKEGEIIEDCASPSKVWCKTASGVKAIPVQVGITNGMLTEIKSGIEPGTEVITEMVGGEPEVEEQKMNNPFMPKPKDKNKKK